MKILLSFAIAVRRPLAVISQSLSRGGIIAWIAIITQKIRPSPSKRTILRPKKNPSFANLIGESTSQVFKCRYDKLSNYSVIKTIARTLKQWTKEIKLNNLYVDSPIKLANDGVRGSANDGWRGAARAMTSDKFSVSLAVLALFSGAALTLAFSPFNYSYVSIISLMVLLFVWIKSPSEKYSFYYGLIYGLAFFGTGVHWVYISIYKYGNAPMVLACAIVALLVVYLALYPALHGYLWTRLCKKEIPGWVKFLVVFPTLLVILEWLRSWLLTGFPWLLLGYSQIDASPGGFAPVLGVYGVSFIVAQVAGALFAALYYDYVKKRIAALCLVAYVLLLMALGTALNKIIWTQEDNVNLRVSIIQGNIGQEQKWRDGELWPTLQLYSSLTMEHFGNDIVVWPEAAITTFPEHIQHHLDWLATAAKEKATTILAGIPLRNGNHDIYYNGIIAIGAAEGVYHKIRLLPFGEYLPLKFALNWLGNFLFIPMADFANGSREQPEITLGKVVLAPFICYEIAYADLLLGYLPKAGLIVTISDDSWFGESIAMNQHLEIARMRSLEVGRYQIFSTNTGISAIIDNRGKIIYQTKPSRREVLSGTVRVFSGATPWVTWGKYCLIFILLGGLGLTSIINWLQRSAIRSSTTNN